MTTNRFEPQGSDDGDSTLELPLVHPWLKHDFVPVSALDVTDGNLSQLFAGIDFTAEPSDGAEPVAHTAGRETPPHDTGAADVKTPGGTGAADVKTPGGTGAADVKTPGDTGAPAPRPDARYAWGDAPAPAAPVAPDRDEVRELNSTEWRWVPADHVSATQARKSGVASMTVMNPWTQADREEKPGFVDLRVAPAPTLAETVPSPTAVTKAPVRPLELWSGAAHDEPAGPVAADSNAPLFAALADDTVMPEHGAVVPTLGQTPDDAADAAAPTALVVAGAERTGGTGQTAIAQEDGGAESMGQTAAAQEDGDAESTDRAAEPSADETSTAATTLAEYAGSDVPLAEYAGSDVPLARGLSQVGGGPEAAPPTFDAPRFFDASRQDPPAQSGFAASAMSAGAAAETMLAGAAFSAPLPPAWGVGPRARTEADSPMEASPIPSPIPAKEQVPVSNQPYYPPDTTMVLDTASQPVYDPATQQMLDNQRTARAEALGEVQMTPDVVVAPERLAPPTTYKLWPSLMLLLFRLVIAGVIGIRVAHEIGSLSATKAMWARTVIPEQWATVATWTYLVVECLIVVLLLFGLGTRIAGALMVLVFAAVLALLLWGVGNPFDVRIADTYYQFAAQPFVSFYGEFQVIMAAAGLLFAGVGGGGIGIDGAIHRDRLERRNDRRAAGV